MTALDTWSALELRHLDALRAIERKGSFRAAAIELGYVQSAISHQIATLEETVGQRLIERTPGGRRLELTAAGKLLLAHSANIVAHAHAARADLDALADGRLGTLRVGTFQSIAGRLGPQLLARFSETMPQIDVSLVEGASDHDLLDRLERGELDLTFAIMPLRPGPFDGVEVFDDPFVLVTAADCRLAGEDREATVDDLRDVDLVGRTSTRELGEHLRSLGLTPRFVFESGINATVLGFVANGYGAAIVPRLMVHPPDDRVRIVELEPSLRMSRRIALVRDRHRRNIAGAAEFEAAAHRTFAGLLVEGSQVAPRLA